MDDFGLGPLGDTVLLCVPCREAGRCRVGITALRPDPEASDRALLFTLACPADHAGAPGIAHGGWTANAFDDMLGHVALRAHNGLVVTRSLSVEYLRPIPVGRPLEGRARITAETERDFEVAAELRLEGGTEPIARATATMARRDATHFTRAASWFAASAPDA